jgi:ribosome-binding factor A
VLEHNLFCACVVFDVQAIGLICVIMGLRQEKFAKQVQRDLGEMFQQHRHDWLVGEFVTISGVKVSPDLGLVKVYLSLYNSSKRQQVMENVELFGREIRMELARRLKNQVKKIPEIAFYEDDSLDYVNKMDRIFDELNKNKPKTDTTEEN